MGKGNRHMINDLTGGGNGGERATGTPNTIYDLSSVLFHALEGGASYDTYIEDAEREGDQELAAFFRRVRDEDSARADDARLLLARRTPTAAQTEGTAFDAAATEGTAPGVAATEDLTPGVAATEGSEPDVSPGPEPPGGLPGTEPRAEGATPGAEAGQSPRTEPISAPPRSGDVPPRRTEEAPPRTEGGPLAEDVPSGTPPQAPPGDVQRGTSAESPARNRGEEDEGLIGRVRDALIGEEERGREGTGREDRS